MNNLILIIGGTSGIGLETANYLFDKNYEVIVCGRRDYKSDKINSFQVDVKSEKSVSNLFNKVQKNYGDINGLVYSTGITTSSISIENFDEKIWYDIIDTNVTGLLRVLQHFFPSLKETKGRVAVVNSIATRSFSQFSGFEYTMSKAALSGLVKQLAIDWSELGILINSVFPSMTLTPMLEKSLDVKEIMNLKKQLPLKKLSEPFDIARAIEFLISKENKYITGSGIDISGGQFLSG